MAVTPIWKDTYLNLDDYVPGTPVSAAFTIYDDTPAQIYAGRSYRRPDGSLRVRVNDICADYLAQSLPDLTPTADFFREFASKHVRTFTYDDDAAAWTFALDWSHDFDRVIGNVFSDPIDGVAVLGQPLVISIYGPSDLDVYNLSGELYDGISAGGTGVAENLVIPTGANAASVIDNTTGAQLYKVRTDICADYALYYVNAFGGWDSLVVQGLARETDRYDRKTFTRDADNATPDAREVVEYYNGITRTWSIRTGWLSDAQSARMRHLLGSTQVYLYELGTGRAWPVVLTVDEGERKTYRGEGAQLVSYTITARLAREIFRK